MEPARGFATVNVDIFTQRILLRRPMGFYIPRTTGNMLLLHRDFTQGGMPSGARFEPTFAGIIRRRLACEVCRSTRETLVEILCMRKIIIWGRVNDEKDPEMEVWARRCVRPTIPTIWQTLGRGLRSRGSLEHISLNHYIVVLEGPAWSIYVSTWYSLSLATLWA